MGSSFSRPEASKGCASTETSSMWEKHGRMSLAPSSFDATSKTGSETISLASLPDRFGTPGIKGPRGNSRREYTRGCWKLASQWLLPKFIIDMSSLVCGSKAMLICGSCESSCFGIISRFFLDCSEVPNEFCTGSSNEGSLLISLKKVANAG